MQIKRYELMARQDEEHRFFYADAQEHKHGYWVRWDDVCEYIKSLDDQKGKNCVDAILARCQQAEQNAGIDWMNHNGTQSSTNDEGSPSAL